MVFFSKAVKDRFFYEVRWEVSNKKFIRTITTHYDDGNHSLDRLGPFSSVEGEREREKPLENLPKTAHKSGMLERHTHTHTHSRERKRIEEEEELHRAYQNLLLQQENENEFLPALRERTRIHTHTGVRGRTLASENCHRARERER